MITKAELIEVLDIYFTPLFQILGGLAAVAVVAAAYFLIIVPFLRRL